MKTIAVAALSLLSGFTLQGGYNYWHPQPFSAAPAPTGEPLVSAPATSPELPAAPAPVPVSPPAETLPSSLTPPQALAVSTPAPLRPAYEGDFWLVSYVSVQTPHGVAGFPPGQLVRVVGANEQTGKLRVSDGTYEVEVFDTQLTDDPELAQRIGNQDQAIQTAEYTAQLREWARDGNRRRQLAMEYADRVQSSSVAFLLPPPVNVYLDGNYPFGGSGGSSTLAGASCSGSEAYCHDSSHGREHGGSHPWHDQFHFSGQSGDANCGQSGGDSHH